MVKKHAFTLIELIVAIAISVMIVAALYFSLKSALDSWQVSQDQLLLQQVSSRLMEELIEGQPETYGLRDALEITDASPQQVSTVMPWLDDTHDVYTGISSYTLNRHIKPGSAMPITEALLPGAKEYKVVPAALVDKGNSEDFPEARLKINLPAGTQLIFAFHPDYQRSSDVITTFRYDAENKAVFIDDKDGSFNISQNPFGVKITDFLIRYFDNSNNEVGSGGSVSSSDTPVITGIEIAFKAKSKNGNLRETVSFVSLRNAPLHSGNLNLREGTRIPLPNSKEIKAFFLTNLYGIDNDDTIILEARPGSGKDWVLGVKFSRIRGLDTPLIDQYWIEYPSGNKIYSDTPRTPVNLGLNLLSLGPNGLYDYDDDRMQDTVILDGKVTLEVKRMDISGAAVFVKP